MKELFLFFQLKKKEEKERRKKRLDKTFQKRQPSKKVLTNTGTPQYIDITGEGLN